MALTVSIVKKNVAGAQREAIVDVTFDSSYPTGGESFQPSDIEPAGFATSVFQMVLATQNSSTATANRLSVYDYTNKKLLLFTALGTEAGNTSDQSAVRFRYLLKYSQVTG